MAEPRFNNPYFWPPPPAMPGQVSDAGIFSYLHTLTVGMCEGLLCLFVKLFVVKN